MTHYAIGKPQIERTIAPRINWKRAKGGPVEVLRRNKSKPRVLVNFSDVLRAHPLFELENLGLHPLQVALKLYERGVMHEVHRNWGRMPRTRRWVIDDLYGAVQRKERR